MVGELNLTMAVPGWFCSYMVQAVGTWYRLGPTSSFMEPPFGALSICHMTAWTLWGLLVMQRSCVPRAGTEQKDLQSRCAEKVVQSLSKSLSRLRLRSICTPIESTHAKCPQPATPAHKLQSDRLGAVIVSFHAPFDNP